MNLTNLISIVRAIIAEPIEIVIQEGSKEIQIDRYTESGIFVAIEIKTNCEVLSRNTFSNDMLSMVEGKEEVTVESYVKAYDKENNEIEFNYKTQAYLNGLADKMIEL